MAKFKKDLQFYKFSAYGFLKNLRFFDPYIILFFLEVGISYVEIGILFSIREIATNFLELPTGIIADSIGRRRSMIFSFLSYIISFIIFYFFPGFYYYIIAMIFFSFGEAFRTGTHKAMILTYLKIKGISDLKVYYYGYTRSASQLGSAVSSLIALSIVFLRGSYRIVFLASIVPYILELFLMMSYPKELDGDVKKFEKSFFKEVWERSLETTKAFFSIFRDKLIMKSLLTSSVFSGLYKGTKDYIQPLLKYYVLSLPILLSLTKEKRTMVMVGIVYFFIYLMTSYTSKKSGPFSKRVKSVARGINLTFLVGVGLFFLSGLFLLLKLYFLSIIFFISIFILENLRKPLNVGYISDKIALKIMATGLSGESQLKTIFSAGFSFAMGVLVQYLGLSYGIIILAAFTLTLYPLLKLPENQG